jgi:protein translocase SecG subunit
MIFFIGILTFLLIVTCLVLVLLILVQLPKKDAGAGLAFGGGAADALFGAGSGNALTKITKWATGIFIGLALILGICQNNLHSGGRSEFEQSVEQNQQMQANPKMAPQTTPPAGQSVTPQQGATPSPATPSPLLSLPTSTNAATPATTGK